jgi:hypothetical protein
MFVIKHIMPNIGTEFSCWKVIRKNLDLKGKCTFL